MQSIYINFKLKLEFRLDNIYFDIQWNSLYTYHWSETSNL